MCVGGREEGREGGVFPSLSFHCRSGVENGNDDDDTYQGREAGKGKRKGHFLIVSCQIPSPPPPSFLPSSSYIYKKNPSSSSGGARDEMCD